MPKWPFVAADHTLMLQDLISTKQYRLPGTPYKDQGLALDVVDLEELNDDQDLQQSPPAPRQSDERITLLGELVQAGEESLMVGLFLDKLVSGRLEWQVDAVAKGAGASLADFSCTLVSCFHQARTPTSRNPPPLPSEKSSGINGLKIKVRLGFSSC